MGTAGRHKRTRTETGKWIKFHRGNAGMTHSALAIKLRVSRGTVFRWERGEHEPSHEMLTRIARVLNAPLYELLTGPEAARADAKDFRTAAIQQIEEGLPTLDRDTIERAVPPVEELFRQVVEDGRRTALGILAVQQGNPNIVAEPERMFVTLVASAIPGMVDYPADCTEGGRMSNKDYRAVTKPLFRGVEPPAQLAEHWIRQFRKAMKLPEGP